MILQYAQSKKIKTKKIVTVLLMFLKLITGDEVFQNQESINSLHSLVGTKFAMILPGILSWRCATLQSCHP